MRNKLIGILSGVVASLILMSGSCNKKEITCGGEHPEITYESNVKSIIDQNCIGCHKGYATFTGLNVSISNGAFEREVITRQTMPQGGHLKIEELVLIKCWLENGATEK